MSVRDTIRARVHKGDTRLLADLRKAASDAAAAGDFDAAAMLWDAEAAATAGAPTTEVQLGAAVEVDIGDSVLILGYVQAVHADAKQVEVAHADEVTTGGYTFPVGYVSTHPLDAITILLPPDPEPDPLPEPELPPIYDYASMKSAGLLVKSALKNQVQHGGPVVFPDRPTPVIRNTASDRRRQEEEREAHAHA
jgi:hypothetical protein